MTDGPESRADWHKLPRAPFTRFEWLDLSCFSVGGLFIILANILICLANPPPDTPKGLVVWGLFGIPVGVVAVFVARRGCEVVAAGLAGSVVVLVDGQPFVPGGSYRGRIVQAGLCRLARARVELACEEAATYRAGTSVVTSRRTVSCVPTDRPAAPLDFGAPAPAGAMHTFKAANNEVVWTVRVSGRVLRVLPYREWFQVVVLPGSKHVG
jgi:hypothetical protein